MKDRRPSTNVTNLDIAEDLIPARVRVERRDTLVLDILHPERVADSSSSSAERRAARRAQRPGRANEGAEEQERVQGLPEMHLGRQTDTSLATAAGKCVFNSLRRRFVEFI
jgi:hypothetical protein